MTHAPETGAENRLHFPAPASGTCVMQICSVSKPEIGVRVTEMMIYRRLLFIFVISWQVTLPGVKV